MPAYPEFDRYRYLFLLHELQEELTRTGRERDVIRVHGLVTALPIAKLERLLAWTHDLPDEGEPECPTTTI